MFPISPEQGHFPAAVLMPFDPGQLQNIDPSRVPAVGADGGLRVQAAKTAENLLRPRASGPSELSKDPAYQAYAEIVVDGQVVATIDNHGWVRLSNSLSAKVRDNIPSSVNGQIGPVLAQARAEKIAALLGGEAVKSASALTQAQFDALPSAAAAAAAPAQRPLKRLPPSSGTLFLAQQAGQQAVSPA